MGICVSPDHMVSEASKEGGTAWRDVRLVLKEEIRVLILQNRLEEMGLEEE